MIVSKGSDTRAGKTRFDLYGTAGFVLAAVCAVIQDWSLPEFCWSSWLAGLVYTWGCLLAATVQIVLGAGSYKAALEKRVPFLERLPSAALAIGLVIFIAGGATLAFRLLTTLFGFYGLFLSVFAEMEPVALFGRIGFINSDFCTPVIYLLQRFWPMTLGVLIASWREVLLTNPWKRILIPLEKQVLRIHVMILALPFCSLLAWMLLGESYQPVAIVLLMGLFYHLPKKAPGRGSEEEFYRRPA